MSELEIVGLGMATLDVLLRLRVMPAWESNTHLQTFGFDGGGPAATAMVAAARLGARVGFVGTAGNDAAADLKLRSMVDAGVDLSRLIVRQEPEKQVVVVCVHSDTGERVFAGVENWRTSALKVEELDRGYITSAQALLVDGLHPEASLQAARWMREAGRPVILDGHRTQGPVAPHMAELVRNVDVLISGSGFAQSVTGAPDVWGAAEAVLGLGPRIAIQTEGQGGSYTVTANERFHTPAFPVDVVDTTGAGDVFHGAFIVGMLRGWDLRRIVLFSTAVSALKCTRLGGRAGIPCFDEVDAFLKQRAGVSW